MKIRTLMALSGCTLLALAACSSKPERPDPPEGYFATHIEADGTRKFQYSLDPPEQGKSRSGNGRPGNTAGHVSGSSSRGVSGGVTAGTGGGGRQASRSGASGYDRFQQINRQLENMLEQELKNSGFCQHGYRETERVVEPTTIYIRGECNKTTSNPPTT